MSFLKLSAIQQQEFLNFFRDRKPEEQNQFLELLLTQLRVILKLKKTDLNFLKNLLQKQMENQTITDLEKQMRNL